MSQHDLAALRRSVIEIVAESGEIIKANNLKPRTIQFKGHNDLVTETDVAVEEMLKERLSDLLPESTFMAEESSGKAKPGEWTWIIDPVDGTTNFAHGLPFVATSVALWHETRPVVGVINLPLMGEIYSASEGHGASMNGLPIKVSATKILKESLLATGFPYDINTYLPNILKYFERLLPATRGIRRPGAAALDLAFVACGRYDGFFENALNAWDTAAGILLVKEAGGVVSQFDAGTAYELGDNNIMATNGQIYEELSEELLKCI